MLFSFNEKINSQIDDSLYLFFSGNNSTNANGTDVNSYTELFSMISDSLCSACGKGNKTCPKFCINTLAP